MNLSELIETHKGFRSYPDLARDCGGEPSAKRLQQLVRGGIKAFPDPGTIKALAKGLRVPQREVVLSAGESLGLDVRASSPRLVNLLPTTAGELSEEQAAAIAHLVDVIVSDPVRVLASMELEAEAKQVRRDATEPTVEGVTRAQRDHLRAVASDGDPDDAAQVEELARQERAKQTGEDS